MLGAEMSDVCILFRPFHSPGLTQLGICRGGALAAHIILEPMLRLRGGQATFRAGKGLIYMLQQRHAAMPNARRSPTLRMNGWRVGFKVVSLWQVVSGDRNRLRASQPCQKKISRRTCNVFLKNTRLA